MSEDCPGSETAGVRVDNRTENNRIYTFYTCEECGVMLKDSPLKKHQRIIRDTTMSRDDALRSDLHLSKSASDQGFYRNPLL